MTIGGRARRRAVERVAEAARLARDPDDLYARLIGALEPLMPVESACWHLTDPLTGVLTRTGVIGEPPGSYERALELEFLDDDVARMADVLRRPRPVAILSEETGGRPGDSARYRDMLAPDGTADELRAGFVDPFGIWGSIVIFGSGRFTAADAATVAEVSGVVAQGLRLAMAREPAPPAAPGAGAEAWAGPAVAVVDGADVLEAADERARSRLADLSEGSGSGGLPGVAHVLAAQARRGDPARPARARVQTRDGRWYLIDASALGEGPAARVALVIQPAPAGSLVDLLLLAYGLTAREREISALVLAGLSTEGIARRLHLSPWTVQDHLKAVFEKAGVSSRRALVARVSAESGRPQG